MFEASKPKMFARERIYPRTSPCRTHSAVSAQGKRNQGCDTSWEVCAASPPTHRPRRKAAAGARGNAQRDRRPQVLASPPLCLLTKPMLGATRRCGGPRSDPSLNPLVAKRRAGGAWSPMQSSIGHSTRARFRNTKPWMRTRWHLPAPTNAMPSERPGTHRPLSATPLGMWPPGLVGLACRHKAPTCVGYVWGLRSRERTAGQKPPQVRNKGRSNSNCKRGRSRTGARARAPASATWERGGRAKMISHARGTNSGQALQSLGQGSQTKGLKPKGQVAPTSAARIGIAQGVKSDTSMDVHQRHVSQRGRILRSASGSASDLGLRPRAENGAGGIDTQRGPGFVMPIPAGCTGDPHQVSPPCSAATRCPKASRGLHRQWHMPFNTQAIKCAPLHDCRHSTAISTLTSAAAMLNRLLFLCACAGQHEHTIPLERTRTTGARTHGAKPQPHRSNARPATRNGHTGSAPRGRALGPPTPPRKLRRARIRRRSPDTSGHGGERRAAQYVHPHPLASGGREAHRPLPPRCAPSSHGARSSDAPAQLASPTPAETPGQTFPPPQLHGGSSRSCSSCRESSPRSASRSSGRGAWRRHRPIGLAPR